MRVVGGSEVNKDRNDNDLMVKGGITKDRNLGVCTSLIPNQKEARNFILESLAMVNSCSN